MTFIANIIGSNNFIDILPVFSYMNKEGLTTGSSPA
jgi:hypothetical protein